MIEVNFFGESRQIRVIRATFSKLPYGHYTIRASVEYTRPEDGKEFTAVLEGPVVAQKAEDALEGDDVGAYHKEALAETISHLISRWIEGIEEWYFLEQKEDKD